MSLIDLTAAEYATLRAAYIALLTTDTPQQVTIGSKTILYTVKNLEKMEKLLLSYQTGNETGGSQNRIRFDNAR